MKNKLFLILIGFLLFSFWFYWFEWRPSKIRSYCDQVAWDEMQRAWHQEEQYNWKYNQCLHSRGLK